MATPTVTTRSGQGSVPGNEYWSYGTYLFDSSYASGGEAFDPVADMKLPVGATVRAVLFEAVGGFSFEYDLTNKKVKALAPIKKYTAALDPASMATDAASSKAVTVTGVASTDICIACQPAAALEAALVVQSARVTATDEITVELANHSAATVDGASANADFYVVKANGAAQEVAASTDLSAVTARWVAIAR